MGTQISSFEVTRLVTELSILEGAFLQKVYQPWPGFLVFRLNTKSGRRYLVHMVGKWLYLTDEIDTNLELSGNVKGLELPGFVKLLRKHLSNGFITGPRQIGFDRIIELGIRKELPYTLIFEMFGKGNVVLSRQGTIVGTLKTRVWRHRTIRGGYEYMPPPPRKDPRTINAAELAVLFNQSKGDLVRTLATSVNLGGTYAEEVCHRTGFEKSARPDQLDVDGLNHVIGTIQGITKEVSDGTGGFIHTSGGKRAEVSAIRLTKYDVEPVQIFATLSQAIEARFPLGEVEDELGEPSDMETLLERLRHQQSQQKEALEQFAVKIKDSTIKAEALYINYKKVEKVLAKLKKFMEDRGLREAVKEFPELSVDPSERTLRVTLDHEEGPIDITLDLRKDINENAKIYYEKAKHIRDKVKGAERALEETGWEIRRIEKEMAEEANRKREIGPSKKRRKRFWFESNRWFVSRNGNVVIGGRDAKTNRKVVNKYLKSGDRYVHADIHGAPSIVVKAADPRGRQLDIPEETLMEACHYAICFSKAWSARIGSGEAYWVTPEQVSTKPQSGEFLPKGGFIIRGKRNLLRNLDLQLSIGLVEVDGVQLVMCATVETMKERTTKSYKLIPSKSKKSDAAKLLSKEFGVSIEEIEAVLPPGGMDVLGLSPQAPS